MQWAGLYSRSYRNKGEKNEEFAGTGSQIHMEE